MAEAAPSRSWRTLPKSWVSGPKSGRKCLRLIHGRTPQPALPPHQSLNSGRRPAPWMSISRAARATGLRRRVVRPCSRQSRDRRHLGAPVTPGLLSWNAETNVTSCVRVTGHSEVIQMAQNGLSSNITRRLASVRFANSAECIRFELRASHIQTPRADNSKVRSAQQNPSGGVA